MMRFNRMVRVFLVMMLLMMMMLVMFVMVFMMVAMVCSLLFNLRHIVPLVRVELTLYGF